MTCFGILGGDRRQLYLARSLREDGHPVSLCGLERGEGAEGFPQLSPEELGQLCQVVLLPLPATRDGITLNAPLARAPILLDSGLAQCLKGCTVLGGMAGGLRKCSPLWETLPVMDYYAREELTLGNAFLTAEGAVALAVEHSPGVQAEPIGPKGLVDAMVVCPCTGNTLSKIAAGITDTPVTMAVKSSLRIGIPVVLCCATNDAMAASGPNLLRLLNTKNVYPVSYTHLTLPTT